MSSIRDYWKEGEPNLEKVKEYLKKQLSYAKEKQNTELYQTIVSCIQLVGGGELFAKERRDILNQLGELEQLRAEAKELEKQRDELMDFKIMYNEGRDVYDFATVLLTKEDNSLGMMWKGKLGESFAELKPTKFKLTRSGNPPNQKS